MGLPAKRSRLKGLNNSKIKNTLKYRNMSQSSSETDLEKWVSGNQIQIFRLCLMRGCSSKTSEPHRIDNMGVSKGPKNKILIIPEEDALQSSQTDFETMGQRISKTEIPDYP